MPSVAPLPEKVSKSGCLVLPAVGARLKSRNVTGTSTVGGKVPTWTAQVQPASLRQAELQPSPEMVLPSSHSSVPPASNMPSPQAETQPVVVPRAEQFGSTSQNGLQPSPMLLLPSSHFSPSSLTPSLSQALEICTQSTRCVVPFHWQA